MLMFFTAYRSASPCLLPYAISSSRNSAQTEALSFNFELNQTQTEPQISEPITHQTGWLRIKLFTNRGVLFAFDLLSPNPLYLSQASKV